MVKFFCTFLFLIPTIGFSQDSLNVVYYNTSSRALLYSAPDGRSKIRVLQMRETVKILTQDGVGWAKVATAKPDTGYVSMANLSNIWIHILKIENRLRVYAGTNKIYDFPADMGANLGDEKEERGSREDPSTWRTPTGLFYITELIPDSEYHRAFLINYPNRVVAAQGLATGVINQRTYDAILQAEAAFKTPPQGTALGGKIEIHGQGTGGRYNWTRGCVALRNVHIDQIWEKIPIGAPVLIE